MSKQILIVEGDAALSHNVRSALEERGFSVEETSDGKGSVELIRRQKPDLVLLAVELPAGQNGYIICGKLKKDDELKSVPVVIVGSPDGFVQHKKLKTHADDYLAKPLDVQDLVERVGGLIGFPEPPATELVDESLSLSDLVDEPAPTGDAPEEIAIDPPEEATVQGDPELDMLDAAFDGISSHPAQARHTADEPLTTATGSDDEPLSLSEPVDEEPVVMAQEDASDEDLSGLGLDDLDSGAEADQALNALGDDESADKSPVTESFSSPVPAPAAKAAPAPVAARFAPSAPLAARPAPAPAATRPAPTPVSTPAAPVRATPAASTTSTADAAELRNLRAKVAELQGAVEDAQARAAEAEGRAQHLEEELSAKAMELETARGSSGKSDKDIFALKEAGSRKDKEILRLKNEINEKDKEIVELRDREMQLEQQASDAGGEVAKRDAQIKTLTTRVEQLTTDRKKIDQQLLAAREEARSSTARLNTLQADLDQASAQLESANAELEGLRGQTAPLEEAVRQAQEEAAGLRQQMEELQGHHDAARQETEELRAQYEEARAELESARETLTQQAAAQEEANALRRQIAELQETTARNEERLTKLYARIKGDEKLKDKTKKALAVALQLMEEQQIPMSVTDQTDDEPATA